MHPYQKTLLHLLAHAISGQDIDRKELSTLSDSDWQSIITLSDEQAVRGLVTEAIENLNLKDNMPLEVYLSFIVGRERIIQNNLATLSTLKKLLEVYKALGVNAILLKGFSSAQSYNYPLHRSGGDIDLWIPIESEYQKAKDWILANDFPRMPEIDLHLEFEWGNAKIENHKRLTKFDSKELNTLFISTIRDYGTDLFVEQGLNGISVKTLSPTFNAFYLFQHLFRHFLWDGIGMRHLLDWVLFIAKNKDTIDPDKFNALLDKFKLRKAAALFAQVACHYLSVSPSLFPFKIGGSNTLTNYVATDILNSGNFGFFREQNKLRKQDGFKQSLYYNIRLIRLYPIAPTHFSAIINSKFRQYLKRKK